jgi:hypothetical protein
MELEFDMLSVVRKLVQNKIIKMNYFSFHGVPKQQTTSFLSQDILGISKTFFHLSKKTLPLFGNRCP